MTRLANDHLVLRPVLPDDALAFYTSVTESIPEISPWMDWCSPGYTLEIAQAWANSRPGAWSTKTAYAFAILDSQEGVLLGGCNLSHLNPDYRLANLSYWVRTSRTGQGIASAAAVMVARFGFEYLGLVRVEIVAAVENMASLRAAEKAGAVREGVLRNRITVRDRIYDAVMFSLIPEDLGVRRELG